MTVAHYIQTNPRLRGMGADAGLALSTGDWPFWLDNNGVRKRVQVGCRGKLVNIGFHDCPAWR